MGERYSFIAHISLEPNLADTQRRLRMGADTELLHLFGLSTPDEDPAAASEINSGRQAILEQGFFAAREAVGVVPEDPEVLIITDHGEDICPAFQFEPKSNLLRDGVGKINRIIKSSKDFLPWEHAFWWISNNGLLDGRTPIEVLEAGDLPLLTEAALREIENHID